VTGAGGRLLPGLMSFRSESQLTYMTPVVLAAEFALDGGVRRQRLIASTVSGGDYTKRPMLADLRVRGDRNGHVITWSTVRCWVTPPCVLTLRQGGRRARDRWQ
jgi:hypothetical protein